jgi:hypothetical protein
MAIRSRRWPGAAGSGAVEGVPILASICQLIDKEARRSGARAIVSELTEMKTFLAYQSGMIPHAVALMCLSRRFGI